MKTTVVNLFGAPGVGKSTLAALLFGYLKRRGYKSELVTEFAKELVWDGRVDLVINNQVLLLAEQKRRVDLLIGKVNFIVTDSPFPLCEVYGVKEGEHFQKYCREVFDRYHNYNIFMQIDDTRPYEQEGRKEDKYQAIKVEWAIEKLGINWDYVWMAKDESYPPERLIKDIVVRWNMGGERCE